MASWTRLPLYGAVTKHSTYEYHEGIFPAADHPVAMIQLKRVCRSSTSPEMMVPVGQTNSHDACQHGKLPAQQPDFSKKLNSFSEETLLSGSKFRGAFCKSHLR